MKLFRTPVKHPSYTIRCFPAIGERVPVIGNHSEAMMHMRLSDKQIEVALVGDRYSMVQLYVDGKMFSFPVTTGEGGFYHRYADDVYYTYVDESRLTAEQVTSVVPDSEEEAWLASRSATKSLGCQLPGTPMVGANETASPVETELLSRAVL